VLLDGLRIVSFCHFLQGPAATQYLADMGAEVIKIEPPQGAFERHWAGADRAKAGGVSAFFLCANRNARSLAIDLKHPRAREVIFRLIDRSHAVVENFRPGTLERLGFGWEAVRAHKPDVIYASASGFGGSGPYAARPGQDLLIQAMSGLAAATGGEVPTPVGCAAVDQHGAALLALGIAGAYAKWLRCGEGTRIEASLLAAGVDLQMESLVIYYTAGRGPQALQRDSHLGSWFHEAPYGIYPLADAWLAISLNPAEKLAEALGSERLRAFVGRNAYAERDAFARAVAEELAGRAYAEVAEKLERAKLWFGRVEDYESLRENPQVRHAGLLREVEVNGVPVTLVDHPLRYDGESPAPPHFALEPGADSEAILSESGYDTEEIAALEREGAVRLGG